MQESGHRRAESPIHSATSRNGTLTIVTIVLSILIFQIYWNTKQYVTEVGNKIVKPVLKRADSVKQIGNTVLSSKYTAFAADTLDGALDVADKYVDKYLPAAVYDEQKGKLDRPEASNRPKFLELEVNENSDGNTNRAIQTMHHVGRFSGKLQRRLTKRTLAEAKALKEHSAEAINVLIYVAELVSVWVRKFVRQWVF